MSLRNEINSALKEAMKEQAQLRLSTLRLITAAIKDRDISARAEGVEEGVDDSEILGILGKMTRQRQDSAKTCIVLYRNMWSSLFSYYPS